MLPDLTCLALIDQFLAIAADTAAAKATETGNAALSKANEISANQTGKTLNEHGEVRFW